MLSLHSFVQQSNADSCLRNRFWPSKLVFGLMALYRNNWSPRESAAGKSFLLEAVYMCKSAASAVPQGGLVRSEGKAY